MTELQHYSIQSTTGLKAEFTNYGARLMSLFVPLQNGELRNVCLGFKDPEDYFFAEEKYFGAIIGRYCNRIANAAFKLDGINYHLQANWNGHQLHGGINAFHAVMWEGKKVADNAVEFKYLSEDGEEGFPGNLEVKLIYTLIDKDLHLSIEARTDKKTVVNITAHPYFNLRGEGQGSVMDHELTLFANHFTPVDESVIPTGEIRSVKESSFDFSNAKKIGLHIDDQNEQMKLGSGYDHNFVLDKNKSGQLELAARVKEPDSGLIMELLTTEPGLQFYTANWLSGKDKGYSGKAYLRREAFCLEPQHYPDSPNQASFPTTILDRGEVFRSRTVYKFYQ